MTGTGQRVSNIGDISEVNYTLDGKKNITRCVPLTASASVYIPAIEYVCFVDRW